MAYKTLGQASPAATTNTDVYTVPASKSAVCSTLTICNQNSATATFRVAVRPAGATLAAQHYIAYDALVAGNDTVFLTVGLTLATTDVVTVYASTTGLSFGVWGSES